MILEGGSLLGRFGAIGKCTAIRDVSSSLGALLWLGSRGGLLGSTPSKNEVSAQFCLPVRSDLFLFVDVGDFAAVLRETDWFDCRSDTTGTLRTAQRTRLA